VITDSVGYLPGQYKLLPVELIRYRLFYLFIGAITQIANDAGDKNKNAHCNNEKPFNLDGWPPSLHLFL